MVQEREFELVSDDKQFQQSLISELLMPRTSRSVILCKYETGDSPESMLSLGLMRLLARRD